MKTEGIDCCQDELDFFFRLNFQLSREVQLGKNEMLREGRKKQRLESELKQTKEALRSTEEDLKSANNNLEEEKVRKGFMCNL